MNALDAFGDALLAWLRAPVPLLATVSGGETLFAPAILIAFGVALWNMADSRISRRIQIRSGRNGGNLMTAEESVRRETYRALRLAAKGLMVVALITNWEFLYIAFAFALLFDAWNEAIDSILVRRFRERIRRYFVKPAAPGGR